MKPAARLPRTVYAVNRVPVFAVAIIAYAVSSMNKDTRAVLRSKRGEDGSLFSFVAMGFFTEASEASDRAELFVRAERFV